ncbi:MAG: signal peptidase II [Lachnospiraceae bacterium]
MESTKHRKKMLYGALITIFLIVLDQLTKYLAIEHLQNRTPFVLIQNVFELQYLENRGAAFGILQGKKWLFVILTVLVVGFLGYVYRRIPMTAHFRLFRVIAILFLAGALGNFIDRVARNFVVDFFYIRLIDFPIFNVADIYVTVATALMLIAILFIYSEDELDTILKNIRPQKK